MPSQRFHLCLIYFFKAEQFPWAASWMQTNPFQPLSSRNSREALCVWLVWSPFEEKTLDIDSALKLKSSTYVSNNIHQSHFSKCSPDAHSCLSGQGRAASSVAFTEDDKVLIRGRIPAFKRFPAANSFFLFIAHTLTGNLTGRKGSWTRKKQTGRTNLAPLEGRKWFFIRWPPGAAECALLSTLVL